LFPLIHLVDREAPLREAAQGWLPGMEELVKRRELMKLTEENWLLSDTEKKKQLLYSWAELLEEDEWQNVKLKPLFVGQSEEDEQEACIRWLDQLPPARCASILAPVAEILYRRSEPEHLSHKPEPEHLSHKAELEHLSHKAELVSPSHEQEEADESRMEESGPEADGRRMSLLKEDIRMQTIQNRIRTLEKQSWEEVKEHISSSASREIFMEYLHAEENLEVALSILKKEHRVFYEKKEKAETLIIRQPDGEVVTGQFPKQLQGTGLLQWKQSLMEWISFQEADTWELLSEAVAESEDIAASDIKETFKTKDKNAVLTDLAQTESIEELFPLLQLVYKEKRLQKEVQEWLPDIAALTERQTLVRQAEQVLAVEDAGQKRQLIQQWVQLLAEEEWSCMETAPSVYGKEGETEQEEYLYWLEKLSPKQQERLLMPVVQILYRREESAEESKQEERELSEAGRTELLREEIQTKAIRSRIRTLVNWQWQQVAGLTFSEIHKEVFLNRLEQLSIEQREAVLLPVAEILYRKTETAMKNQRQTVYREKTERTAQEILREEIGTNEIQSRIRSLETQHWEAVRERTSFAVTKEQFLKHIEQFDSKEELEAVIHTLQYTHRLFYYDRVENQESKKRQTETDLLPDIETYRKSFHYLQRQHDRNERTSEVPPELYEQQEAGRQYRQAVHRWMELIEVGERSITEQRSLRKNRRDRTVREKTVWENTLKEEYSEIHFEDRKTQDMQTFLLTAEKKRTLMAGKSLWTPKAVSAGADAEKDFSYEDAQIVISRSSARPAKEMQVTPVIDVEKIVKQVKEETVHDIQFVRGTRTEQESEKQNTNQLNNLLKQLSSQQKEMEQMKQVQARLIQSTDMSKVTETVMKQFKIQLRTEKLRRGL
ncbi:MAG: hypothetical protein RR590_05755, partial [Hungatella sp.]